MNDNYYLLMLAAIAKEIRQRGLPPECSVRIAAGLPLTSFGRDKPRFRDYLLRSRQPVNFKFEGVEYSVPIDEVAIFPQGYAALMTVTGLLQDEPSMLLMDLGGWTVDLMRIEVKRGYEIKLVLDANYRQFLDGKIDYGVEYLIEKTDIQHRNAPRQISKMTA